MGQIFAGSEIVELGVQIEINGWEFYSELAEHTKDKGAKEVFLFLANEEKKHIDTFRDLLKSVVDYQPQESYPGEYFAYMNALASDYVFTQKDKGRELAKQVKSDSEALQIGIRAEKDSIIFFDGMKRFLSQKEQNIIDYLIEQEKSHLQKLYELKKTAS